MTAVRAATAGCVLALVLLAGWAGWSTPSAPEAGSAAAAYLLLAGGVVVGVLLGRTGPTLPGLAVLGGATIAFAMTLPGSLSGNPLAPPTGYMNANGALLLCAAAGAVVAATNRSRAWRLAASGVALLVAVVCLANGARAAVVGAVLLAAWNLVRHRGPDWGWLVIGGLLVVVPGVLTLGWGAGWLPRTPWLERALAEERFDLWREAHRLMVDHPVNGVGAGWFSSESPTAADPDLAWAHSYWWQAGAELGVVGLVGVLLALLCAIVALGRDSVVLGVLLLPASVDHVLHFAGVLAALSLLVGGSIGASGTGKPRLTPPSP